jgi:transposase
VTQLEAVLDGVVVARPEGEAVQHLCADKAYDGASALAIITSHGYVPHVCPRGIEAKEKKTVPGYKARRWVVEACHSWINRFRKLLVRFEKTDTSYIALVHLACAIISWRKVAPIYG